MVYMVYMYIYKYQLVYMYVHKVPCVAQQEEGERERPDPYHHKKKKKKNSRKTAGCAVTAGLLAVIFKRTCIAVLGRNRYRYYSFLSSC